MVFREIRKSVRGRLSALKTASEFSALVSSVIRTLHRNGMPENAVAHAVHDRRKRVVTLYASSPKSAARLVAASTVIRAALRREGVDVGEISVR